MEDTIEWDAFLQQLPDSPAICLDDFLLPLMDESEISPPDPNGEEVSCGEQGSLTLSILSDILLNDEEDFQVLGAGDGAGEFLDMKSFIDEFCTGDAENDVDRGEGFQVDACNDVDEGNHVHADADDDVSKGEVVDVEGRKKRPAGGGEEEKAVVDLSRKRKRESAVKSRERKKVYVEFLEANCGMMEKRSWGLEESLSYSTTENVVLKHELTRMKDAATVARHGGGGAELAALLADSLQKESLLCLLMTWVMLMVLVVARLPSSAAPLKAAAIQEKICKYGSKNCMCGGGRKWKWSRKKPKECHHVYAGIIRAL